MFFRRILTTLLFSLAFSQALLAAESGGSGGRPNILFIYTDDHSYRTISAYEQSYPWVNTPNIDRLAARGVRFEYAYIGTWCMPSRATLLTGKLSYGVESMRMEGQYPGSEYDPEACPFWPATFRANGYTTAQIGKWHTGTDTGAGRDWDHQIVWNRPRYPQNSGAYYYDQIIETNGGEGVMTGGYSTDNYTKWAIDFIQGGNRDAQKPWYLWLCYGAVHGPFTPAERHLNAYPDVSIETPTDIYPPREGKPDWMQLVSNWQPGPTGEPVNTRGKQSGIHGPTLNNWVRQYHQGVLALDESIGQLVATLETTGQLENTLIVFTSDQGFAWGQHGFRHKMAAYDANIRSPMIVSMPGTLPEGAVCPTAVGGADLIPTFFSFAGIEKPWKMHGRDLTELLKNPRMNWNHPTLTVLTGRSYGADTDVIPANSHEQSGVPWWVSLRAGNYKYIRSLKADEIEELYDLKADPDELTNLALQSEYQQRLLDMREQTISELRRTDAGFVDGMPAVGVR